MSAMPSQSHAWAGLDQGNVCANRIHHPGHFMPRNLRVRDPRKQPEFCNRIAVANTAGLHANTHMSPPRLGKLTLNHLKISTCGGNLHGTAGN
jgi:hypothetical protein